MLITITADLIDLALLVVACAADLYRFACHRT